MSKTDMYGEETGEYIRHLHIADNIKVLRNMKSESVDLIYLDPPFNSKKQWENAVKVKPGAKMKIAFKDAWNAGDIHTEDALELRQQCSEVLSIIQALSIVNGSSWEAYLIYMSARLIEMRRVLKNTGSIYYHCDPTMSHGVKLVMDAIFGGNNFRNEIVWAYAGGGIPKNDFPRKHDVILRYSKTDKYSFNVEYRDYGLHNKTGKRATDRNGTRKIEYNEKGTPINDWWIDVKPLVNWNSEKRDYPTQKPLTLLERIIKASTNEGDIVMDPFCGCATACVAAERLKRQWIGMDIAGVDDRVKGTDKKYAIEDLLFDRIETDCGDGSLFSARQTYKLNPQGELYKRDDLPSYNRNTLAANLYAQQNKQCQMCDDEKQIHDMEIDHILPKARGGQDEYRNLQLICSKCNGEKGSKTMSRWRQEAAQRKAQSLFAEDAEKRRKEMEDKMVFGFNKKTTKNK